METIKTTNLQPQTLKEEILKYLEIKSKNILIWDICKERTKLATEILKNTEFLPKSTKPQIRIEYCLQELTDIKRCKCGCGSEVYITNSYLPGHARRDEESKKKWLEKMQKTSKERYGDDYLKQFLEKAKESTRKNYGVDYSFQSKQFQKDIQKIIKKKYGVSNVSQLESIKQKKKESFAKTFGCSVEDYNNADEFLKKIVKSRYKNTFSRFDRFSKEVVPMFSLEEYNGGGYDKAYKWLCKKCGNEFEHWYWNGCIPKCPTCYPICYSSFEIDVANFLSSLDNSLEILKNDRKHISPLELDIYLPSKKLAFELNGNHWHTENIGGKDKNYHLNKTIECELNGTRLIHIFEDEWLEKNKISKAKIKHLLGQTRYSIGARKCEIRQIDNNIKNVFLDKYHIQGRDKSSVKL
ncbi:MAG TPA: hypothetical protein PLA71_00740 [Saccharofermentans sp.]|nr:hypothetical protein [Saccharofermentans sp.]